MVSEPSATLFPERSAPDTTSAKEVLLEQWEYQRVDCIFASPIAVMAPIWEALARCGSGMRLRYFRCRHELLAVALASGYYKATRRSQIVFCRHLSEFRTDRWACTPRCRNGTPMTVLSPDTLTYGEDRAPRPGMAVTAG
jgi:acetolactate synthase I/II/III large subunit